jgi:Mn2+/Fe2+ NRAMP family transporter
MESRQQRPSNNNTRDLLRYASMGTQIFVALGIAVFVGLKADKWLKISAPLLVLILPVLVLVGIIYKIVKETSKPKNGDAKE